MPIQTQTQTQAQPVQDEEHTSFYLIYPRNEHEKRIRILSVSEFCQSRIHSCYQRVAVPGDFVSIVDLYIHVAEEHARF